MRSRAAACACGGCSADGRRPPRGDRRARSRAAAVARAMARDRERGLHRLAPGRDAAEPRADGRGSRQLRDRKPAQSRERARGGRRGCVVAAPVRRGGHRRSGGVRARVRGRRRRTAPGGARLGAAIDRRSARDACRERDRLPQHAGGRARCARGTVRLCGVEFDLRRSFRAAEGRGLGRASALPLRGVEARRRTLRGRVRALLRNGGDRASLLQRFRRAAGSGWRVRGGDPALGERAAIWAWGNWRPSSTSCARKPTSRKARACSSG